MRGTVLRAGGPVRHACALAALVLAIAGCGASGPTDEEQVRTTLTAFTRATASKDYQALCDRLLAPSLIDDLKKIGLPSRRTWTLRGRSPCEDSTR